MRRGWQSDIMLFRGDYLYSILRVRVAAVEAAGSETVVQRLALSYAGVAMALPLRVAETGASVLYILRV